ncbi:pyridoxamine 5'-phosphate oxidase family protein [Eubacterium sp. am_0171]|uniref:pyridoxamine 5'-phosphate oxidase family protein n=1 Tax=unclassified Eubacterium (in: firmicutes) TaxID=2624479 RepID=UPI0010213FA1|nr:MULTISPECIES: pyridoxamine 5'-phosphate oxidase family protein [unclassified Eubacterium (in: firmicutes)]MSC83445.1 pyridoxamine 5'-phosphate oxidase family protein [Eubacterium sp. BIOML-A1]MSD05217.1 pyridoxamine 5'-phosphate oxidase family protein [Eubacterium sp. BIOML-A2]RYT24878.1 pyridoxamine 5'-phosphate oxidase family protein [Eubacterium sp. am_0171]
MPRMRRRDREIESREEILHVLDTCKVVHLAMYDEDGIYMLPMNFGYTYEDNNLVIYIHAALEGKKLDLLRKNPNVGFELDCDHELIEGRVPCQYGFRYASLVGKGVAEFVEEPQEKMEALSVLMKCQTGKDFEFTERLVTIVSVIKITAKELTGKRRE